MKWTSISLRAAALAFVVIALGATTHGAFAQYPPPTGSVSLAVPSAVATIGASFPITAQVTAPNGAPVVGAACTFQVTSQPGSDASVDPGPFTTDANGAVASELNVGSTPGTIVVGVQCDGGLSGRVVLTVAGAAPSTGAVPPAGAGMVILPSTGVGPVENAFFGVEALIALVACGVVALTAGSALMLRARGVRIR